MTAAILFVVWLLVLAAIIESGVTHLMQAVRTLKAMRDE